MLNVGMAVGVAVGTISRNSIRPSVDAAIYAASSLNHSILAIGSYGYSCGCHLEQGVGKIEEVKD